MAIANLGRMTPEERAKALGIEVKVEPKKKEKKE